MKSAYKILGIGLVLFFPVSVVILLSDSNKPSHPTNAEIEALLEKKIDEIKDLNTESIRVQGELLKIEEKKNERVAELKQLQNKIEKVVESARKDNLTEGKLQPRSVDSADRSDSSSRSPQRPAVNQSTSMAEKPMVIVPLSTKLGNMAGIAVTKEQIDNKTLFEPANIQTVIQFATENKQANTIYVSGLKKNSEAYSRLKATFESEGKELMRYSDDDIDTTNTVYFFRQY